MKMRKLLAIVMTLALVMSFSVGAMAADTGKITVKNVGNSTELKVYQILTYTLNDNGTYSGVSIDDAYLELFIEALNKVSGATAIADTATGYDVMLYITKNYFNADGSANDLGDGFAEELGRLLDSYVTDADNNVQYDYIKNVGEAATDGSYEFGNLPHGYYLVLDTTTYSGTSNALAMLSPTGSTNVVVTLKTSTKPPIEKVSDVVATDGVQIGESIGYTVSFEVPNYSTYTTYEMTITDTLGIGLNYNFTTNAYDGVVAKIVDASGDTLKTLLYADDYTVDYTDYVVDSTSTLTIKFADISASFAGYIGEKVVVTYSATVTANAPVSGVIGNEVVYNPDRATDIEKKTTEDHTYGFELTKVDFDNISILLQGVTFALYQENTDGSLTLYTFAQGADGIYRFVSIVDVASAVAGAQDFDLADYIEDEGLTAAVLTTGSDGMITALGLKTGDYLLEELETLSGYNLLTEPEDLVITTEGTYKEITVKNTTGILIPGTGGIGTTLFTIFGGVIILGAFTLLIANRKRIFGK